MAIAKMAAAAMGDGNDIGMIAMGSGGIMDSETAA
jgi:hypothetical protein